jgi:hypothetical protein
MPTVFRANGFEVRILLPPREHGPPHVHISRSGEMVVIELPDGGMPLRIRTVTRRMTTATVVAAVRLVEEHTEMLLSEWRKYHG